jgi:hypothetical protein
LCQSRLVGCDLKPQSQPTYKPLQPNANQW